MYAVLISFVICLLGVMVTVLLFSLAMRPGNEDDDAQSETKLATPSEDFFLDVTTEPGPGEKLPLNALLLQLERHVRLEQKAAEEFLQGPSAETLHAPSKSSFFN